VFGAPQHISATNHIYAIMTRGRLTAEACKYLYNITAVRLKVEQNQLVVRGL
jgi:hypothetical protein